MDGGVRYKKLIEEDHRPKMREYEKKNQRPEFFGVIVGANQINDNL